MRTIAVILFSVFGIHAGLFAQALPLHVEADAKLAQSPPGGRLIGDADRTHAARTALRIPAVFLPAYARSNPSGYSPLCRLELRIERRMPVGVWFRLPENPTPGEGPRQNAYLRLRLLPF